MFLQTQSEQRSIPEQLCTCPAEAASWGRNAPKVRLSSQKSGCLPAVLWPTRTFRHSWCPRPRITSSARGCFPRAPETLLLHRAGCVSTCVHACGRVSCRVEGLCADVSLPPWGSQHRLSGRAWGPRAPCPLPCVPHLSGTSGTVRGWSQLWCQALTSRWSHKASRGPCLCRGTRAWDVRANRGEGGGGRVRILGFFTRERGRGWVKRSGREDVLGGASGSACANEFDLWPRPRLRVGVLLGGAVLSASRRLRAARQAQLGPRPSPHQELID